MCTRSFTSIRFSDLQKAPTSQLIQTHQTEMLCKLKLAQSVVPFSAAPPLAAAACSCSLVGWWPLALALSSSPGRPCASPFTAACSRSYVSGFTLVLRASTSDAFLLMSEGLRRGEPPLGDPSLDRDLRWRCGLREPSFEYGEWL